MEIKSVRKKTFSTSIDKNSEIEVRYVIYICWHFLISRHDWTWPQVCMRSLLFTGPEREKKGTYTLDRQYQIIVVCERKRGWNKIKFFFLFLTHKEHDVFVKRGEGDSREARVCTFFFLTTLSNYSFILYCWLSEKKQDCRNAEMKKKF
jgi:hypothetical protein